MAEILAPCSYEYHGHLFISLLLVSDLPEMSVAKPFTVLCIVVSRTISALVKPVVRLHLHVLSSEIMFPPS